MPGQDGAALPPGQGQVLQPWLAGRCKAPLEPRRLVRMSAMRRNHLPSRRRFRFVGSGRFALLAGSCMLKTANAQIISTVTLTFILYLMIGLPLAVLPPYVHDRLGLG